MITVKEKVISIMERPQESLNEVEILIILFYFSGSYRKNTEEIAKRLLEKYGSLSNVLESDYEEILLNQGIRKKNAYLLNFIPTLTKKFLESKWGNKPLIESSKQAGDYAITLFADVIYESFYVISLDNSNKVNYARAVFNGTIDEAPVYPRLVVEEALRRKAKGIIISHNHPGGSLEPSKADIMVTKKIKKALDPIAINVVDHIIVANGNYTSFADRGIL